MPTLPQSKRGKGTLSPRLSAVADGLGAGGTVCDVGSDHGYLALFLLQRKLFSRAIVTDIRSMPLRRAQKTLEDAGFKECVTALLCDGIAETLAHTPEAFAIAGMGAETIVGILSRVAGNIKEHTVFSLQPMTHPEALRRFLYENGFCIEQETLVWEGEKPYLIFRAIYDGRVRLHDSLFYEIGAFLPRQKTKSVAAYFHYLLRRVNTRLAGKNQAGIDTSYEKRLQALLQATLKECV